MFMKKSLSRYIICYIPILKLKSRLKRLKIIPVYNSNKNS